MCGRFTQTFDVKKLLDSLGVSVQNPPPLKPSYNIAPAQPVAVFRYDRELKLELMSWGLVPSWAKDPKAGYGMINARSETLDQRPSFKGLLRNHRCLIPSDGFYEWKQEGRLKKPYFIRMKSKEPFTFAALWSHWAGSNGSEILSCAIITGAPNELLKPIHHRMPVILPKERRAEWLSPDCYDPKYLSTLLEVYPENELEAYPVSTRVNDPKNDSADCIQP